MSKFLTRGPMQMMTPGLKAILIRIAPNGASAPSIAEGEGAASVARTAAGRFTITLNDQWKVRPTIFATAEMVGNASDIYAQAGVYTAGTGTAGDTVVVRTLTGATETDVAADANNMISVLLVYRITDVQS